MKLFPDHLEVKVVDAPQLHVRLREVGLKVPENVGVGEPTAITAFNLGPESPDYRGSTVDPISMRLLIVRLSRQ